MNQIVANDIEGTRPGTSPAASDQTANLADGNSNPGPVAGVGEVIEPTFSRTYVLSASLHAPAAGNHIFVFLDGTWNEERSERGRATPTNVLRLFQEVTEGYERQLAIPSSGGAKIIARYYRGVGSRQDNNATNRLWFGFSGKDEERIRAAAFAGLYEDYKSTHDSIYILGFSRGAASARLLARDICDRGFPPELKVHVKHFPNLLTGQIEARVERVERLKEGQGKSKHKPKIAFLGCWDTVDAFALPSRYPNSDWLDKAGRFLKNLTFPRLFWEKRFEGDEKVIPGGVSKAVHCVAIDETRNAFLPTLMPAAANVEEVWFPGVHADVGGGYEDNLLAEAPYAFMKARLVAAAMDGGADAQVLCNALQDSAEEKQRPLEHCFHFHGLNTDIKHVKDILGFGTNMRAIRTFTGAKDSVEPKLHVSALRIMNGGTAFAADKRDRRTWSVAYDPYNVRELRGKFTLIDERTAPAADHALADATKGKSPADATAPDGMGSPAGKPERTNNLPLKV